MIVYFYIRRFHSFGFYRRFSSGPRFYDFSEELGYLIGSTNVQKIEELILEEMANREDGRLEYRLRSLNNEGKVIRVLQAVANPINITIATDEVRRTEGALTPAVSKDTIDGMSLFLLARYSDSIRKG